MKYKIVDNMIVPKKDAKFIKLFIDEEFKREAIFFTCLVSVAFFALFIIPIVTFKSWSFTTLLVFFSMVSIVPMVVIWLFSRSHQAYLASKRTFYLNDKKGVVMSAIKSDNPLVEEVFEIYFNSDSFRVENKCIEVMSAIMKKDELNKSLTKGGLKDAEDEIAIESFISTVEAMKELNGD